MRQVTRSVQVMVSGIFPGIFYYQDNGTDKAHDRQREEKSEISVHG
jgi:hypothetical protein